MGRKLEKSDLSFLLACLFLGVASEEIFFRGVEIGVSYLVFIASFYSVFYWRYHHFSFSHQRLGWLVLICIWLLAASYLIHNNPFFYCLNLLIIPGLVMFHLVLITSPRQMIWNRPQFAAFICSKLLDAFKYNIAVTSTFRKSTKEEINQNKIMILKKIIAGLLLSVPVLVIVLGLLMSADTKFKLLVGGFPDWFYVINIENIARFMFILISAAIFFGVLQVLPNKSMKINGSEPCKQILQVDGIIALTVLAVMNLVYLLFTFVQFKYFFTGALEGDFTYAQYARKGFFELLFVSVINLSILTAVLTFVRRSSGMINRLTQIMLTILIFSSSVILLSAFIRLSMYEDAYGFTFLRILAHSFMIFLAVIFAYTLVRVWIENLSLGHFFVITSLVYYAVVNTIDLNQLVVTKNIERYESSGKVDVQYMNKLSYTGVLGLITLYEKEPNIPNLNTTLKQNRIQFYTEKDSWKSYNLKKQQVKNELSKLQLK